MRTGVGRRLWGRLLRRDSTPVKRAASLYEAFTTSQARRLVERLEWH